ncbi:MAG: hypothetical protein EOP05_17270 [Proteobacteria bacterium]|nr:MAG: hypothetical protein EOP05_17270 [Pseudomonadota bacterium]
MQQKSKRPVKFAAALALLSTVAVGLSGASALANDSLPSGLVTTKSAAPKPAQVGQQAAIALVKNGERLTQIDSDLAFLESVENLNGVDHKTQTLTPETIERLSSIEGTETFVIEDGPSILAVLARVQSIELSHNKGVSNVSLLPFKAPIAQEPTPIGFHFPSNVKPRVSCERAFEGS